jgi:Golgi SNAP receptor complex protein 2
VSRGTSSHNNQNALFNSALRQSTSIRKDLDQFADTAAPSPHLAAQLNASLTTFARTVDDYGKLAKQEPVQTKQEKAFERLKTFRGELEEYRDSFKRIKSANEDVVCVTWSTTTKRRHPNRTEHLRSRLGLTSHG